MLTVRDGLFEDFADRAPELEQTLELLTGQFTNEVMSELTYRWTCWERTWTWWPQTTCTPSACCSAKRRRLERAAPLCLSFFLRRDIIGRKRPGGKESPP